MKSTKFLSCISAIAFACLSLTGCGGGSSSANVVTVTVFASVGTTLILGQSTTLTATVTGATNTNVNWQPCQFTTTTVSGTTTTTSKPAACPTDGSLGVLSNEEATGTATFTAPNKVPDQTKFPGLQIIITAQSQADTSKNGTVTLFLDSGIGVTLTPGTATVATNETQSFSVVLTNDLQTQGVTFLLTQSSPTSTITVPNLASCSPGCGTITNTGNTAIYTAPATVPTSTTVTSTPANVTIVATAKADVTRFAAGTITIIQGGPITFNGLSPSIAPQGAAFWDIFLDAPNISSSVIVTITDQNGGHIDFTSAAGNLKVLFPIPNSTTTNPTSTGARLRLLEADLAPPPNAPITYTVSITDPANTTTPIVPKTPGGNFSFTIIPVRPTVVSTTPDDIVQGAAANEFPVVIDGGYFGPGGEFGNILFQGNVVPQGIRSNARQLDGNFSSTSVGPPGLYPLAVSRTAPPAPIPNNPAVSTIAVFPDYRTSPPTVGASVTAGTNPSAIDIDPTLGIVAVAETGSNAVQFFTIGAGTLTPLGAAVPVGQTPTGLSINRTNHTVAVVNYGDQSVTVLPIPTAPVAPGTPFTFSISGLLNGVSPAPVPYAIGVDPDTNLALVAYSSTSSSSNVNLGFVINLNSGANSFGCLASPTAPGPCVFSQVTLDTGTFPQIAMSPHGHLAFVTPGGSGIVRGVDVTQQSTSNSITSLTVASGLVTATTANTLTGVIPGIPTSVLISGVPGPGTGANTTTANFNGVFAISVTSSNTFQYALNTTASGTVTGSSSSPLGTVSFATANLNFSGLSATTQGIAINPITRTAALADANATGSNGPQINILRGSDQSTSSISFQATCTAFSTTCANSPELLGTADIAWQPYTNSIVSYNPNANVNQVSVSDPVTQKRYAIVQLASGTGSATITVANGTTNTLTLFGGIAVDPATNQAFVVQSGSGTIQTINLGPNTGAGGNSLKPTEITEVVVPSPAPGLGVIGGIPNAFVPNGTLTSTAALNGVQVFGAGFAAGAQVRLDGTPVPTTVVSDRVITANIPASFLAAPHRYALDVISNAIQSNATDFFVIKAVDMSGVCSTGPASPSSVAIADQIANGPFSPIAVVTNSGCNNISTIDINPTVTVGGVAQPNPNFGKILNTIAVGTAPQGIAVSQHFGFAVVANNGSNNVSVVDLSKGTQPVPAVAVGTGPTGIAISEETAVAIVTNTGSNSVSELNLGLLSGTTPATSLTASTIGGVQQPIAVAIDPDGGTNNQGLAVVTGLQLVSGQAPVGALFPIDIGLAAPALSTTVSIGNVTSTPTGIVFDPTVGTIGVFYVNSSGSNVISTFNPDPNSPNGGLGNVTVGINPTALALNSQTGAILTSNLAGKSASIVDTLPPLHTVQTIGLPGSAQFGVAIDQFTNIAVIVDQAHNRVFLFPMPN
ncbi:MAG TPA: beta-propeller fold lactonase family protein [Candidatus Acidoferrum sp.]|jgi:DNA-binding beta-propeller fold protein YncE